MLYLLWGLLNLGLFVFFLVICLKAVKLIRDKMGLFAAIVLVVGLASFMSPSNKNNHNGIPNSNGIKEWTFESEDSLINSPVSSLNITLERTFISRYNLDIFYRKNKQELNIPVSASSSTTGFISGTSWTPESINVTKTKDNNTFQYSVTGLVDWKLLGSTIYTQSKTYKGAVQIKK